MSFAFIHLILSDATVLFKLAWVEMRDMRLEYYGSTRHPGVSGFAFVGKIAYDSVSIAVFAHEPEPKEVILPQGPVHRMTVPGVVFT